MRLEAAVGLASLAVMACASAKSGDDDVDADPTGGVDAAVAGDAAGPPDAGTPDAGAVASACPPDEFATGLDELGLLQCAPIDATATAAFETHCSLYLGFRDSCDGCTTPPAKWGSATGTSCANGAGADNTCTTPALGGVTVRTFGLNLDGDVNDDDKLYLGLHCTPPADDPTPGPCPAGSYVSAVTADGVECVTGRGAIVEYLRGGCNAYYGWRDSCDGCTSAPAKWGRVGSTTCVVGIGAHTTCTTPVLGGESVRTLGLNTDGDVNGDDKLYLGFQCGGAAPGGGTVAESCPAGQLVVGIEANGSVVCASPLPAAEAAVQDGCYLYFGWRDSCDGCTSAPSKWGRVSHATCENGVGADNTCATTPLDGTSIPLFGLNTDGDVGGDDKLYAGLACP